MDFKNISFENQSKWFNDNYNIKKNSFNFFDPDTSYESLELKLKLEKNKNNKDKKKINKDLKTGFYWEDLGHIYPYDPKLKYCIYFKGCCCPPHKGHIDSIRDAVKIFGDCKIVVNQIGSSSRHGTPKDFNSELLQKYLKTVFPNNDILYMFRTSSDKIFKNDFVLDSDVLVIIRGDEIDNVNVNQNKYDIVNLHNKKREKTMGKNIKFLNKNGIRVDYLMQKRNVNKISATKFIEKINIYKNKLSKGKNTQKELGDVMNFIPNEFNYDEKFLIVNRIIKYKTWSEKN